MSMSNQRISEATGKVGEKSREGLIPIRLITEGKGSRGDYSRELLAESGVRTFTKGTFMFINHPKDINKPWERDLNTVAAKLVEDAEYKEVDGEVGLWSWAKPRNAAVAEFLEEYRENVGVSVYVDAKGHTDPVTKRYIVESFVEDDPYKSVDFVISPGRGGGIENRVMESMRAAEHSLGIEHDDAENGGSGPVAESQQEEEQRMDELLKAVESLTAKVEALDAKLTESKTLSENAKTAEADKIDALTVAQEATKAIAEANLPEGAINRVFESVAAGKTVAEAVRTESDYVTTIAESTRQRIEEDGRFSGGSGEPKFGKVRF